VAWVAEKEAGSGCGGAGAEQNRMHSRVKI